MNSQDGSSEADGLIKLKNKEDFIAQYAQRCIDTRVPWVARMVEENRSRMGPRKSIESAATEATRLGVIFDHWRTGW